MRDEHAFLTAICAEPENDTPRAVYADWLDEQELPDIECPVCLRPEKSKNHVPGHIFVGWGHNWQPCVKCGASSRIPDTSRKDRAEFIRTQIEIPGLIAMAEKCQLAHYPDVMRPRKPSDDNQYSYECHAKCQLCRMIHLREREDDLIKRYAIDWLPSLDLSPISDIRDETTGETYRAGWIVCGQEFFVSVIYQRGFIESLVCSSVQDWLMIAGDIYWKPDMPFECWRRKGRCDGTVMVNQWTRTMCRRCNGTGWYTESTPTLCPPTAQPIRNVTIEEPLPDEVFRKRFLLYSVVGSDFETVQKYESAAWPGITFRFTG